MTQTYFVRTEDVAGSPITQELAGTESPMLVAVDSPEWARRAAEQLGYYLCTVSTRCNCFVSRYRNKDRMSDGVGQMVSVAVLDKARPRKRRITHLKNRRGANARVQTLLRTLLNLE